MDYVKLGNSGLEVSKICLGCMSFGEPGRWHHDWVIGEEESRKIIKRAVELGINFFDTANVYSMGNSEEILGRALRDFANRDEIVVATKVHFPMNEGRPNSLGLSRKAIMREIDGSLKRLGMDYVDLYIIHRWDYRTPIEETMEALHDVIKAGKARYIGASAMFAWQFQKALYTADKHGWTRFISMQNHYNLIYREDERELIPLCKEEKIALTPYSPLAAGRLARPYGEVTKRYETDEIAKRKYDSTKDVDKAIIDRVEEIAKNRGVSMSQVSLAWLMQKDLVVVPIVGVTKVSQLEDAVNAVSVKLTEEEIKYLEEPYIPHPIVGPLPPPKG